MHSQGIRFERQKVFPVIYNGDYVSSYIADLVIDDKVIIECKSVVQFTPVMFAQIINYIKLAQLPVGLLINFANPRVEWKRFVNSTKSP
jgi:GxxExxY protein